MRTNPPPVGATERGRENRATGGLGGSPARPADAPGPRRSTVWGLTRERPGAEGPVRIAPADWPSQGDSGILPGGIASGPPSTADHRPVRGRRDGLRIV